MLWVYGVVLGITAGLATGALAERLPIPPLLQTLGATFVAVPLAAIALVTLWVNLLPSSGSGGLGAVSAGLSEAILVLALPAFLAIAAGLHIALGHAVRSAPWLAHHRVMAIACLGGLCGALPVAWLTTGWQRALGMN